MSSLFDGMTGKQNSKKSSVMDNPALMAHLQAGAQGINNPGYKDVGQPTSFEELLKYMKGGTSDGRW